MVHVERLTSSSIDSRERHDKMEARQNWSTMCRGNNTAGTGVGLGVEDCMEEGGRSSAVGVKPCATSPMSGQKKENDEQEREDGGQSSITPGTAPNSPHVEKRLDKDDGVELRDTPSRRRYGRRCCFGRRLRVGFLSAFFFHHSVGLLMQGVVTRLDVRCFETTAIFLQPHPTIPSAPGGQSGDRESTETGDDDVYTAIRERTENVLDIPASRCKPNKV